jgi:guanosine-3',5'-bis(diphosphate) 3'-pyrophosphohydrolase
MPDEKMIRITEIIDKVAHNNPEVDLDIVRRAYIFSARVHEGQTRLSGEPYLSHPLEVAGILADMTLDPVSIAAGLLHDVIEDTHATLEEIDDIFGPQVGRIVSGVTNISKITFDSSQARQAESIRKMILAMADDIRVILVKLADRLHNMNTLKYHQSSAKRKAISQETLDIYAPIAGRLGIYWMKKELEETAFMHLYPEEYTALKNLINTGKAEREEYIETVENHIRVKMDANHLPCEILGRYKHYFSIFRKMKDQKLAFEDVYDIIAFRIIVEKKAQCYEVLGIIHDMWKPIDIKFKDYIARPKPNMYQSLHTTVIGYFGERIEIQIRTFEMDRVAKSGIAAHWSYKEGRMLDENMSKKFAWIQDLVENQENFKDPDEFLENVRIDLFPDEVYVFTPNGEVKTIPKGATPVDFAYLIHSDVGHQCTGAKVNGRIVPLQYQLITGDMVEIITTKNHKPSKDWLKFVKTVKARSRIRQWIKTQDKARSINLGREMCEKEFRKNNLNFNKLLKSEKMIQVVDKLGFKHVDDLIASVGYGKNATRQLVREFLDKPEADETFLDKLISRVTRKKSKTGVVVKGVEDMLIRLGKCCKPLPGDPITGYITRGFGVTVHRKSCVNAMKINPERRIDVAWSEDFTEPYPVKIHVSSHDRVGLLRDIATNISKADANILDVHSETLADHTVESLFTVGVKDVKHLEQVIRAIKNVKRIQRVRRVDR